MVELNTRLDNLIEKIKTKVTFDDEGKPKLITKLRGKGKKKLRLHKTHSKIFKNLDLKIISDTNKSKGKKIKKALKH